MNKNSVALANNNFLLPVFTTRKIVFYAICLLFISTLSTTNAFAQNETYYAVNSKWCTHDGAQLYKGDFNGDGRTDLLCKDKKNVWIDYADKNGHLAQKNAWQIASNWCSHAGTELYLGDFNGDGRTDLMCKDKKTVWIDYADKNGHVGQKHNWQIASNWCTHAGTELYFGDFDGDGRTDLMCKDKKTVWIDYADKNGHVGQKHDWQGASKWCTHAGSKLYLGDFNGDGRTDLMCKDSYHVWIDYADKNGYVGQLHNWQTASKWCTNKGAKLYLGDFNGDKRTDLLCKDANKVAISYADKNGYVGTKGDWETVSKFCSHTGARMYLGDFNGDGRTNLMCKDATQIWIDYISKTNPIIKEDTILTKDFYGAIVIGADNITLNCDGHVIKGGGSGNGIKLVSRTGVTVENCIITNFDDGIQLNGSNNNVFRNNLTHHNINEGFDIEGSNLNRFIQNSSRENGRDGFDVEDSNNNEFIENVATQNGTSGSGGNGIELDRSSDNTFMGNTSNNNLRNGFSLDASAGNNFDGNVANNNGRRGFQIETSNNNTFNNNNACGNDNDDARLQSSANNVFCGNNFCTTDSIPGGFNNPCP